MVQQSQKAWCQFSCVRVSQSQVRGPLRFLLDTHLQNAKIRCCMGPYSLRGHARSANNVEDCSQSFLFRVVLFVTYSNSRTETDMLACSAMPVQRHHYIDGLSHLKFDDF